MSGMPTGLDLLNSLAALAVALFVLWLLLVDLEFLVRRAKMVRFLCRRISEECGSWPTVAQRVRISFLAPLPFVGDRYLRGRLRRYTNHPAYREEWRL